MTINNQGQVIVALDFPGKKETMAFLDHFDRPIYVKVGMELFYKEGPAIIREIKDRGHKIFLDLKLHDIPNTVEMAMRSLAGLDVDMVNLHAQGGRTMMEAGLRGLEEASRAAGKTRPLLIAVTQLTSTSQEVMNQELAISGKLEDVVVHYAKLAKEAGLNGVVSSPLESPMIHEALGLDFLTVTPGVRFQGQATQDQKRVTTPARAKELTSSYIVMGRAITQAPDPLAAYQEASRDFQ